jgi:hypothetical protein
VISRNGLAGTGHTDKVRKHIVRLQERVDDVLATRQLTAAHSVEHRFEHVCERYQTIETEDSGAALYRVDGAEYRIDGVIRCRSFAQI